MIVFLDLDDLDLCMGHWDVADAPRLGSDSLGGTGIIVDLGRRTTEMKHF